MKRVVLSQNSLNLYFESIATFSQQTHKNLASTLNISERTLRDWNRGKFRFPLWFAKHIEKAFGVTLPKDAQIESEGRLKALAGRKGAVARNAIYGNPGTVGGRKKGGLNSLKTHLKKKTGFKMLKEIANISKSEELAEFIGVMIGDGGMTQNQIRITLGLDEREYSKEISNMMRSIFNWTPSISIRKRNNTIELVLSGRALVQKLYGMGLLIGDKVKQEVSLPDWTMKSKLFVAAVLRGMFDTDGSVYLDKHYSDKRCYSSLCMAFTSYSPNLLSDIRQSLYVWDFHPTSSTKNRIVLRRREEVIRFFKTINPRNFKHLKRFTNFME